MRTAVPPSSELRSTSTVPPSVRARSASASKTRRRRSPEPSSAAPISGVLDPCETTFEHRMSVARVWEAPRVTLPYSDLQWGQVDALGKQVDADLRRMDVRLTQGGEPTFVSVDDREGGEWNTEAMGPTKRALSGELMARLRA